MSRAGSSLRSCRIFAALISIALAMPAATASGQETPVPSTAPLSVTFEAQPVPSGQRLHQVGLDGRREYGLTVHEGKATITGQPVRIEIVQLSDLTDRTGTGSGILTLRFDSGDELGFSFESIIVSPHDELAVSYALMIVIAGSGDLESVKGGGSFEATRLGSELEPTSYALELALNGLPEPGA